LFHESLVAVGFLAAQPMIHMHDGERDAEFGRQFAHGREQGHRIGAAGNGYGEAVSARQHVITKNCAADPVEHGHSSLYPAPPALRTSSMDSQLRDRASRIELLLMDVDGVLTDGHLYHVPVIENGVMRMAEFKGFDSQDGIGLQWCAKYGIATGVISGRVSDATTERARQNKMKYVYQGHTEKIPILEEILADAKVDRDKVAYIGDDLTDIVVMRRVGFAIAVANARPELKPFAHYTTRAAGGSGAVREAVEMILTAKGLWQKVLAHYEAV
jgi:3-deoxy-D-manno-octulosonate 8-phosphate phosphatase (KDO 8-P phosphatase)